jgi:anti-sigma B factor antagonist
MGGLNVSGAGTLLISHQQLGREVLVTIAGEFDMAAAPVLKRYLTLLADEPGTRLFLDLGGVSFVDSAGFRAIVLAADHAGRRGCHLTVVAESPAVRRLRELHGR